MNAYDKRHQARNRQWSDDDDDLMSPSYGMGVRVDSGSPDSGSFDSRSFDSGMSDFSRGDFGGGGGDF